MVMVMVVVVGREAPPTLPRPQAPLPMSSPKYDKNS